MSLQNTDKDKSTTKRVMAHARTAKKANELVHVFKTPVAEPCKTTHALLLARVNALMHKLRDAVKVYRAHVSIEDTSISVQLSIANASDFSIRYRISNDGGYEVVAATYAGAASDTRSYSCPDDETVMLDGKLLTAKGKRNATVFGERLFTYINMIHTTQLESLRQMQGHLHGIVSGGHTQQRLNIK